MNMNGRPACPPAARPGKRKRGAKNDLGKAGLNAQCCSSIHSMMFYGLPLFASVCTCSRHRQRGSSGTQSARTASPAKPWLPPGPEYLPKAPPRPVAAPSHLRACALRACRLRSPTGRIRTCSPVCQQTQTAQDGPCQGKNAGASAPALRVHFNLNPFVSRRIEVGEALEYFAPTLIARCPSGICADRPSRHLLFAPVSDVVRRSNQPKGALHRSR